MREWGAATNRVVFDLLARTTPTSGQPAGADISSVALVGAARVRALTASGGASRSKRISSWPSAALGCRGRAAYTARGREKHRVCRPCLGAVARPGVGPVDLDNGLAVGVQLAREPGAVAAGAFYRTRSTGPSVLAQAGSAGSRRVVGMVRVPSSWASICRLRRRRGACGEAGLSPGQVERSRSKNRR
jgi:hypothetical protein